MLPTTAIRTTNNIHQPFPISQITPSTIILGSAHNQIINATTTNMTDNIDTSSVLTKQQSENTMIDNVEAKVNSKDEKNKNNNNNNHNYNSNNAGYINNKSTDTIPFSRKLEASSVIVTSNEPPERCTSPRRDNVAIERIGREKVLVLRQEAQLMQDSLSDILERLATIKEDYERLSNENRFLQDYIGNLMATSNILNKPAQKS